MSHINDGLLHAYLDGALHAEDPAEADRVERHLAVCDDCRARLEAARHLHEEADALLEAATPAELDMPPFETIAARAAARASEAGETRLDGGPRSEDADLDGDARAEPDANARIPGRRRRFVFTRTLAWAASIVIALGMGWWARELAYQPGGLPQASMERERAAAPADATEGATAPQQNPGDVAGLPQAAPKEPEADAAPAPKSTTDRAAAKQQQNAPAVEQPKAMEQSKAAERLQAATLETRVRTLDTPAAAPSPAAGFAQPKAEREMAPSVATDAATRGTNWSGVRLTLSLEQAETWLGGPVYGVGGLNVVRVVPNVAPDGARSLTVYQQLPGADTLDLHQVRPASGDAFTLGGGTGVLLDGTFVYTNVALPPDSVRALLRRLVPLRR